MIFLFHNNINDLFCSHTGPFSSQFKTSSLKFIYLQFFLKTIMIIKFYMLIAENG